MDDLAMMRNGFDKLPHDSYFTIDSRCIAHLDRVFPLNGIRFTEPCAGAGHLIRQIEACGGVLEQATDLIAWPGADARIVPGVDVLTAPPCVSGAIVTNPPFGCSSAVVAALLNAAPDAWVIVLLRATQAHVQAFRPLMNLPYFYGMAPLPFRPKWFEGGKHSPRHDFAWFLWCPENHPMAPPRLLI